MATTAFDISVMLDSAPPREPARAAIITGPRTVSLQSTAAPQPGPRQVLIRLQGCGVCGSNVPVWEGRPWFNYPLEPGAPGHEGWGIIEDVGEEVVDFQPGDRVAALSYHAFAEYDIADATSLVWLPAELADRPFPGEPLACAMNVFRRAAIESGQTVAIVGIGFLGALLTQLAQQAGARVIAISRRPDALQFAEQAGADVCLQLDRDLAVQQVQSLTGGHGCDCVIEATGYQEPLDLAAEMVAVRGRLVIAGYHQDGLRQVNLQSWNWRGIDVINAHERDPAVYVDGMRRAVDAVTSGALNPWPLFTHEFSLDELGHALDAASERPNGFLKALVRMD